MITKKYKSFNPEQAQEFKQNTLIGNLKTLYILQNLQENYSNECCVNYEKKSKFQWILKEKQKKCGFCESQQKIKSRYAFYGPNCVIYLGILTRLMFFMTFLSIFIAIPLIILNSKGSFCKNDWLCNQKQFTYSVSILNIFSDREKLIVQVILWLLASIFLSFFFIYLRIYILRVNQQIDNENVTEGDYCIIIRRAPLHTKTEDIQQLINKDIKIEIMNSFSISQEQANTLLKIQSILPLNKMDRFAQQLNLNSQNFKKSLGQSPSSEIIHMKLPYQFSGSLIVIFSNNSAKEKILSVIKTRVQQQILSNVLPFLPPKTQFRVHNKRISIGHAPEPTDLIIENLGYSIRQRFMHKLFFTFLVLMIIGISCVISYFLQLAKQKLYTKQFVIDANIAVYFSIIAFVFNKIISKFIELSIKKQKLDTKTFLIRCRLLVTVFHQSISLVLFSIIIPLFINAADVKTGLKDSKFPTAIVVMIVFKAIASNTGSFLEEYFEITSKIEEFLYRNNIIRKTQSEANEELKGNEIDFSLKCADLTQLFWFSLIFGIVSPICIFVASFGVFLWIIYDRILFMKRYSIPQYTNAKVLFTFVDKLELIVFFIGLSNLCAHLFYIYIEKLEINSTIFTVSMINLIYGVIFNLLPLNKILTKLGCGIAQKEQKVEYQSQKFLKSYKRIHSSAWLDQIMYQVKNYRDQCGIFHTQRKLNPQQPDDGKNPNVK